VYLLLDALPEAVDKAFMTGAKLPRTVLVACLGNPDCGDDGIGPAVGERLRPVLPAGAALVIRRGDMLSLIEDFAGYDAAVCVDAAAPMGAPGRVHRIDLASGELPQELLSTSTHGFGLAEAIEMARALGRVPQDIIIFAIEGACFDTGAAMTPQVLAAVEEAARLAAAEAGRLSGVI
jgi:hydrogenase maturation protease